MYWEHAISCHKNLCYTDWRMAYPVSRIWQTLYILTQVMQTPYFTPRYRGWRMLLMGVKKAVTLDEAVSFIFRLINAGASSIFWHNKAPASAICMHRIAAAFSFFRHNNAAASSIWTHSNQHERFFQLDREWRWGHLGNRPRRPQVSAHLYSLCHSPCCPRVERIWEWT